MPSRLSPAVFFDKDGTLIENVPYNVDCTKIKLLPWARQATTLLHEAGYKIVVITNQGGVALGYFTAAAIAGVECLVREMLAEAQVPLAGFYYCPHHPQGVVPEYSTICDCRKPRPGLIRQAAQDLEIDLSRSWFIGDILDDVEAGHRAGCRSILLDNGGETLWQRSPLREPDYLVADLLSAARAILGHARPPHHGITSSRNATHA
jgi:D-glycero-D-manno-heptose 1,7-bisphosphate phosphatase